MPAGKRQAAPAGGCRPVHLRLPPPSLNAWRCPYKCDRSAPFNDGPRSLHGWVGGRRRVRREPCARKTAAAGHSEGGFPQNVRAPQACGPLEPGLQPCTWLAAENVHVPPALCLSPAGALRHRTSCAGGSAGGTPGTPVLEDLTKPVQCAAQNEENSSDKPRALM